MGDYCNSFAQYWDYIKQPDLPFGEMLKLGSDPPTLFTQWSVFHLFMYVLIALVWAIVLCIHDAPIDQVVIALLLGLVISYLLSHLGWFIIVLNNGCCHPIVSAILGILFILWGCQYLAYAVNGKTVFTSPHFYNHDGDMGQIVNIVRIVLFILYGISLIYMGIAAIMCCNAGGGATRGADDLEVASGSSKGEKRTEAAAPAAAPTHEIHVHVHMHHPGADAPLDTAKLGKTLDGIMDHQKAMKVASRTNGQAAPTTGGGDTTPGRSSSVSESGGAGALSTEPAA